MLLIIHVVSLLKKSRFYYFFILFGQIKTSFRDVSYFKSKSLCSSEKNTNKNETGTEDRVSTTARIVRNCTEESGNPVD